MKEKILNDLDRRMDTIEESIIDQISALCYTLGEIHFAQYLGFLARETKKSTLSQSNTHIEQ